MRKKWTLFYFCLANFLFAGNHLFAQEEKGTLMLKLDVLGIAASLPGKEYIKVSPELEWQAPSIGKWSITVDYERYSSKKFYLNQALTYLGGEIWEGFSLQKEHSARIGLRRYFGQKAMETQGIFAEIQCGGSNVKVDTLYYVIAQPSFYHQKFQPELRLRSGYQKGLSQHWLAAFGLEGDIRRLITGEKWFRCAVPELNIVFKF